MDTARFLVTHERRLKFLWIAWIMLHAGNVSTGGLLNDYDWAAFGWVLLATAIQLLIAMQHARDEALLREPERSALPPPELPTYPPPRPKVKRSGFVYLVRSDGGLYKIGHTTNPTGRIHRFEVVLPFEVEIEHLIPCEDRIAAERLLHHRYAQRRIRGEWFALTPDEVMAIKAIERM